jgi:hypothetical protein
MERFFSTVVRNERIKLAALFWNITGAGLFVGAVAGAFFVRANFWPKFGIGLAEFILGMLCYWLACHILTYLHHEGRVIIAASTSGLFAPLGGFPAPNVAA